MDKTIVELVEELPGNNLTVKVLKTLDFVVPNQWETYESFEDMITGVTKNKRETKIAKIRDRAIELYANKENGYQTAVWLYQTVDVADQAIAAATFADKVGETFRFIPFLDQLTPKADTVQSVDLKMKLLVELIAYSNIHGLTLNPIKFAEKLSKNYQHESLMRMASLVCLDGLIPLGPDFISRIAQDSETAETEVLTNHPVWSAIKHLIPSQEPQKFLNETFNSVQNWLSQLTPDRKELTDKLGAFLEIADDKLDYLAAFLDASVNYFEYTGIQTVARQVIKKAYQDFLEDQEK